jgi:hypothetical protein
VSTKSPGGAIRDLTTRSLEQKPSLLPSELNLPTGRSSHFLEESLMLKSAKAMLAYIGGFTFTSATLEGLRAIQVSTGASESSRGKQHISGLRLVYDESTSSVVLGQWISEFACIELAPGERLTEITTWHDFTNRFSHVKFGPITGIRFVTSHGAVKEFLRQPILDKVCLKYHENPYENLVCFSSFSTKMMALTIVIVLHGLGM